MKNNTEIFLESYQELEYNIELAIFRIFRKNKIKENEIVNIELPNGSQYSIYVHRIGNASEIRIKDIQKGNIDELANNYDLRILIDIFDALENKIF